MTNPPCPHCGSTDRYTDPNLQVRCTGCFNHLEGEPDTPIGSLHDDSGFRPWGHELAGISRVP